MIAAVIPASMNHLLSHPAEYGAKHDAYVGGIGEAKTFEDNSASVASIPEVAAAAGIMEAQAFVDDDPMQMLAFAPLPDQRGITPRTLPVITPRILTGREPIREDEVAMGQVSMTRPRTGDR